MKAIGTQHHNKNPRHITSGNSSRRSRHSNSTANSLRDNTKKMTIRRHLTPDVVEVNGWRLPKEVEEYALANDLTEEQLFNYEQLLLEQERKDEIEFQRRRREMANQWNGSIFSGNGFRGDINHQLDDTQLEDLESDAYLRLPPRKSRLWYFGFQHSRVPAIQTGGDRLDSPTSSNGDRPESGSSSRGSRFGKSVSVLRHAMSSRNHLNSNRNFHQQQSNEEVHLRRHLKADKVLGKRPLSASDVELLRCIGLDTFVMIRFLRFCFDVTFFPFIVACIILLPSYAYNNFEGEFENEEGTAVKTQTYGYFSLTINRLEPSSSRLWICFGFAFFHLIYILRRLWIEWETFLPLRFDFLVNGDVDSEKSSKAKTNYKSRAVVAPKDDVELHLEQYRNSCIVEYVPDSHRRDQELHQYFDAVFPNQVKRAEILVNATELTKLIKDRQNVIEKYERTYTKYSYKQRKYIQMQEGTYSEKEGCCSIFRREPKKPTQPIVRIGKGCNRKAIKALPYYTAELKNLNRKIDSEYKKVSNEKKIAMDNDERNDLMSSTFNEAKRYLTGENSDLKVRTYTDWMFWWFFIEKNLDRIFFFFSLIVTNYSVIQALLNSPTSQPSKVVRIFHIA